MKQFVYLFMALAVFASACKKDKVVDPKPVTDKVLIAEATISQNQKVVLWADDSLTNAYHKIYFSVLNATGSPEKDKQIKILPVMDMGDMKHSSPFWQPEFDAATGLYEGAVVFTMPGETGWQIETTIGTEKVHLDVPVKAAKEKLVQSFTAKDGQKYVISLIRRPFTVGLNDFTVTLHHRENMMVFNPVNDASIEFRPEMTSMGHGSPNNVQPVFENAGKYKGKVNFTMTGDWRFYFNVKRNAAALADDLALDILF